MVSWFRSLFRPNVAIGSKSDPYLLRWHVLPRNMWLNIYLHKFLRDDDDRALHDHPWWFVSLMIWGGYVEITEDGTVLRSAPSIAYRRAEHRHRVALVRGMDGKPIPCWTLVLTGPKVREWGFWCPQGFVPWQIFCDPNDVANVGRGCD